MLSLLGFYSVWPLGCIETGFLSCWRIWWQNRVRKKFNKWEKKTYKSYNFEYYWYGEIVERDLWANSHFIIMGFIKNVKSTVMVHICWHYFCLIGNESISNASKPISCKLNIVYQFLSTNNQPGLPISNTLHSLVEHF